MALMEELEEIGGSERNELENRLVGLIRTGYELTSLLIIAIEYRSNAQNLSPAPQ